MKAGVTHPRRPRPDALFTLVLQAHNQNGGNVPVPMQPIHRLAHLAQRPDGGVEWACPQCGRYLIRYPNSDLVVAAGVPGPAHILGPGHRDDPVDGPTVSQFDQQFLHRHAMAWSTDHRPEPKEQQ